MILCDSGDAIFHNSFMGALAVVPADKVDGIERFLQQEITEQDLSNESLKELCEGYFFFPSNIDEQELVSDVLDRESKLAGFNLILLPHENCNFRCVYCYENHKRGKMGRDVIEGLMAFIDNKASEGKSLHVSWFGGEPLLAKDVIYELSDSFIRSCEKHGILYDSNIVTNGYLLSPEVVDCLLKLKVSKFQVTFDGPEITHDSTRKLAGGGKTYKTILNNLIEMHKMDANFHVTIRVNFNYASISVMDQFFTDIDEAFGADPRFGLYFRPIGKWGGQNDPNLSVCAPKHGRLLETELMEKYMKFGFLDNLIKRNLTSHGYVCYAAKESSIVVGSDGTVYKCTVEFDDSRNQVGTLTKDGRLVIDQSRWDLWVKNVDKDTSECTSCPLSPSCQGKSCPRNSMNEKRAVCPLTATEYKHMVKSVASGDRVGRFL